MLALLSSGGPRTATRSPRGCGAGSADIAEGTVYALLIRIEQRGLVDVEKVPSEGAARKVCSLNDRGRSQLEDFWRTWSFLQDVSNSSAQEEAEMVAKMDRVPDRVARTEEAVQEGLQGPRCRPCREPYAGSRGRPSSATSCTMEGSPTATILLTMLRRLHRPVERARSTARRCARSSARTRWSSPRRFALGLRRHPAGSTRSARRLDLGDRGCGGW